MVNKEFEENSKQENVSNVLKTKGENRQQVGSMDYCSRKEYTIWYALVTISGLLSIVLVFIWTCVYLGGFGWLGDHSHQFNYHPALAIIGLVVLYGKGLLIYRTLSYKTKSTLKLYHTIAMLIVFVLSVISLNCVFDSHGNRAEPIPYLYTLHSWIGLGTEILFAAQLLCGFGIFIFPGASTSYRSLYLKYHHFFGIIIFILSILSCHSGIMETAQSSIGKDYQFLPPEAIVSNLLGVSITVFAILVLFLSFMPQFKRIPPPEDKICMELNENS